MVSLKVLTLDLDDITGHLKCDEKTAYQILGMAKDGKFSDIIMDDFWLTLDAMQDALKGYSSGAKEHYQILGEEIKQKEEAMQKRSTPSPETIEKIYELAFGEDAISRDFSEKDLISTLEDFTEKSHAFEVMQSALQSETSFDINKGVSE